MNETQLIQPSDLIRDVWVNMPPEILHNINFIINIVKAIGIAFLVYIIFMIVRSIFNIRAQRRIKYIRRDMREVNEKLDLILKKLDDKHANPFKANSSRTKKK